MTWLSDIGGTIGATLFDIAPIAIILFGFQALVLRQPLAHPRRVAIGFVYVTIGLALFLVGLEKALFPLGKAMAIQLAELAASNARDVGGTNSATRWQDYFWVYVFAATIGFSTTIAEPALIAVAKKAGEVSGGALNPWGLRLTVALGVAIGVSLGAFRIVTGTPLPYYIMAGYLIVIVQTLVAPRAIIALAYDSGGVTTSTVTVPLVTALGLGLATAIPGRSPLIDGFGLIAFASVLPIISVLGYAQLGAWRARRAEPLPSEED